MSTYAWIIDRVNVAEIGDDCADEKGICGPSDAPAELLDKLQRTNSFGHTFRMLDDDGIWYYRGRIAFLHDAGPAQARTWNDGRSYCVNGGLSAESEDDGTEPDFGPLNDFGTPNAGATEIQYRCLVMTEDGDRSMVATKVWATL